MNLEAAGIVHAHLVQHVDHRLVAPDEHRHAVAAIAELDGGAQHHLFLGFGKDHALGLFLGTLIDLRQHRDGGVEARPERTPICVHVVNRFLRDAAVYGGLRHGRGDHFHQARIEGGGNDIFAAELVCGAAIGIGHLFRHALARQCGNGMGRGDLHLFIDRGRAHVQRTAEDEREAQDIVDLIGIVRATGGDDRIGAHLPRQFGQNLGIGIGHGKDDRLVRHAFHHVGLQRPGGGKAQKDVRADQRFGQAARLGAHGMGGFPLVHALGAALIDRPLPIAHDHILMRHAHRLDQLCAGDGGGARAVDHHLDLGQLLACQFACVDQPGGGDDGGAMLIVMEDGDVHPLPQGLLDDEAFRRGDILQIDAAEARLHQLHGLDEPFRIFGLQLDIDRVDIGEPFEQDRLAFHHRLGGQRPQIAQAQNGGAVGDDRDQIALGR